ncbi:MAG TPA: SigE family RNA polymerase sigma factor [Steroidobacteraceae bacterium]
MTQSSSDAVSGNDEARPVTAASGPFPDTQRAPAHTTAEDSVPPVRSFEELFRAEFAAMLRLAHLLGATDAENVAQEALLRLHLHWAELSDRSRAGGYLRATVVNLCRSAGRKQSVAERHTQTLAESVADSAETIALDHVSDRALLFSLGSLAPRHREALVLRFWLDLSEAQMAEAMGCSAGSVKSHVSRGLSALRAALEATSEDESERP